MRRILFLVAIFACLPISVSAKPKKPSPRVPSSGILQCYGYPHGLSVKITQDGNDVAVSIGNMDPHKIGDEGAGFRGVKKSYFESFILVNTTVDKVKKAFAQGYDFESAMLEHFDVTGAQIALALKCP